MDVKVKEIIENPGNFIYCADCMKINGLMKSSCVVCGGQNLKPIGEGMNNYLKETWKNELNNEIEV